MQDLSPLDKVGWLSEQSADFQQWVAANAKWRNYKAGQLIYLAGDPSDGLYGLASGAIEITFPLIAEEPVVLHRAQIGFWIGDMAEFTEEPRVITMTAAADSRLLHITSAALRQIVSERPHYWISFYKLSRKNVTLALSMLAETLSLSVRARICRRLLKATEVSAEIDLTQEQLAKLLGLARTTVSSELVKLQSQGAIEIGYGKLRVLDRSVLIGYQDEQ